MHNLAIPTPPNLIFANHVTSKKGKKKKKKEVLNCICINDLTFEHEKGV